MTVLRQLRSKGTAIIGEDKDEGYDKAFSLIQPVIQGTADTDVENKSIQKKAAEGVEFALGTMKADRKATEQAILEKFQGARHLETVPRRWRSSPKRSSPPSALSSTVT